MPNFGCFFCPSKTHSSSELQDVCPECGREYGFPIYHPPERIREYRVREPLRRGFYSCTYVCWDESLAAERVLKVTPKRVYEFFRKDFTQECKEHTAVAEGTSHVVQIFRCFDEEIQFGEETIDCHVAVLQRLRGVPLAEMLDAGEPFSALAFAQVAMDLFHVWGWFLSKRAVHNDLHEYNILVCQPEEGVLSPYCLDPSARAVAVDLGSVASESLSSDDRLGDQHQLCKHLNALIGVLERGREEGDDLSFRLLEVLIDLAAILTPAPERQRGPTPEECIREVFSAVNRMAAPWQAQLQLQSFDDAYNALTLAPWFVPRLLVDPDGDWVRRISTPGPQIITGMRGCGKTMLLKALQFHARASSTLNWPEDPARVIERLREDAYVGLFVSCTRLLEGAWQPEAPVPFARLFIAYCREIVGAMQHLRQLDPQTAIPSFPQVIGDAITECLRMPQGVFENAAIYTGSMLDQRLVSILIQMRDSPEEYELATHSPKDAFERLAEAVRTCSPLWRESVVLFLLDDVGTRYLRPERVQAFFSALLFPSEICAFKFTTELQTLEMGLVTPGGTAAAREGRDYSTFDLGAEVYRRTRTRGRNGGKRFLEMILEQRRRYYPMHPRVQPSEVLGDCTLRSIAREIAAHPDGSASQKQAYHGITALAAACVGDIGDVIRIYERMLRVTRGRQGAFPLPSDVQSDCYQYVCSRLLFDLNRRRGELKSFALSFAQAAHRLLVESLPDAIAETGRRRFREFGSIYVQVTPERQDEQLKKLRDLIDAGVFVLDTGTPRSKQIGADPILQFHLTYRKLFGLSSFIGLGSSDRFELTGEDLDAWLGSPERGTEILLGTQRSEDPEFPDDMELEEFEAASEEAYGAVNIPLFPEPDGDFEEEAALPLAQRPHRAAVAALDWAQLEDVPIDAAVLAMGFEDRALESARFLFKHASPRKTILLRYPEKEQGLEVEKLVRGETSNIETMNYLDLVANPASVEIPGDTVLIDITGMAKPAIFALVRGVLRQKQIVYVMHTHAAEYYPLDEHIDSILAAEREQDYAAALDALQSVLTGEEGGYDVIPLLEAEADSSRRRALFAFASAKHEKLFSLLDFRDFDSVEIILPARGTSRGQVAHMAAEIAALRCSSVMRHELDSFDLAGTLEYLERRFHVWYTERGYNVEIDTSGSKAQAVAGAVLSLVAQVSRVWYVQPKTYDWNKFTTGASDSTLHLLAIGREMESLGTASVKR